MLDSSNGTVYFNSDNAQPFVCPQCTSPVPYTEKPLVQCPTCYHAGNRDEFKSLRVIVEEPN